jgi:tetratricopeptide (TPR) repeat protein
LNRSQTLLQLERYNAALKDAEKAIELLEVSAINSGATKDADLKLLEKAYYRKCNSLYGLRYWRAAHDAFAAMLLKFPVSTDAKNGLEKCLLRLDEQSTGKYNIVELYNQYLDPKVYRLNIADYVGPVKVFQTSDRGGKRGIQVTRDVKPGELLLVTKAFGFASNDMIPAHEQISLSFNLLKNAVDPAERMFAIQDLIYHLCDQRELAPKVYGLYAGNGEGNPADYDLAPASIVDAPGDYPVDPQRIDLVATFNSFGFDPKDHDPKFKHKSKISGLFPNASLFNHSCLYNAIWVN